MPQDRSNMPSHKSVRDFWASTSIHLIKWGNTPELNENRCFACGGLYPNGVKLDRSHIVAKWCGGPDATENLHLLCRTCHLDSEDFCRESDQDRYWRWFFARDIRKRNLSKRMREGDADLFLVDGEFDLLHSVCVIEEAHEFRDEHLDFIANRLGLGSWSELRAAVNHLTPPSPAGRFPRGG